MDVMPLDPTKLTTLLNELEEESQTRHMPVMVAIGAVRRAVTHHNLDAEPTK